MNTFNIKFNKKVLKLLKFSARNLNNQLQMHEQAQIFHQAREWAMYRNNIKMAIVRPEEGQDWRLVKATRALLQQIDSEYQEKIIFEFSALANIAEKLNICGDLDRLIGRALWMEDSDMEKIDQLLGAYASPDMIRKFKKWREDPKPTSRFLATLKNLNVRYLITDDVPQHLVNEVGYYLYQKNIQFLIPQFKKLEGGGRIFKGTVRVGSEELKSI